MYPIVALSITGLITLFLGFSPSRKVLLPATVFFLLIGLLSSYIDWNAPGTYFSEMLLIDNQSIIFSTVLILATILVVLLSDEYLHDDVAQPAEYLALVQFALVGAIIMVSFKNLIMLFVGIEILSVSIYVLTGSDKRNIRGNEAAVKYLLMGSFATGILLFGMAMYYGGIGTFDIMDAIPVIQQQGSILPIYFSVGIVFMLIGMFFKVSAAPFHFWTPDVYEGAPTIYTTFMSTIVKTAGFAAIYKVLSLSFGSSYDFWAPMVLVMTTLTIIVGNMIAVYQVNFKRMLAYSSISHAGYMMLALVGLQQQSIVSIAFYSVAYVLATITAFGVLMVVSKDRLLNGRPDENISVLNGLAKKNGFLAFVLAISMLSLSGIPLTAGFWGKFMVFNDAANKGYWWLLIVAICMSAVSIYYYFKPIRAAFLKKSEVDEVISLPIRFKFVFLLCLVGTLLFGLAPDLLRMIF